MCSKYLKIHKKLSIRIEQSYQRKNEGDINALIDKQSSRKCVITRPSLILKKVLALKAEDADNQPCEKKHH